MAFLGARRLAALSLLIAGACYDTGDGTAPPADAFYFPVGLRVSHGGNVLYAINSDFDLQFNGGTIQSYDLHLIRQHALLAIANPADPLLPLLRGSAGSCPSNPPIDKVGAPGRQPLGETCAPPVSSQFYFRDSGIIGAFATDLLLSPLPSELVSLDTLRVHSTDPLTVAVPTSTDRLFAPIRGNATLTWATVVRDDAAVAPVWTDKKDQYAPFRIQCGQDATNRCDGGHEVGEDINEPGNTRHILLPGEPFGATFSQDGTSIVMTHQNDQKTSLFSTGMGPTLGETGQVTPALQFVVEQVPVGGMGVAPVPLDPDAFLGAPSLPRPAFFETSRSVAQVTLLRQYNDTDSANSGGASIPRPFLTVEAAFPVSASAGAVDSRGIAIDITPRLACKAKITAVDPAERDRQLAACARKPARAFIANRTPAALLIGDVGSDAITGDDAYDPARLTIHTSIPLSAGPSNVYLAPIVDRAGNYALRVFAVCFDSATVFVYDPDVGVLENVIKVGVGPFAMAFDPFNLDDVAQHKPVPIDMHPGDQPIHRYRFGYVASFTQSYVQLLDLDSGVPATSTFEKIVYTLGLPTNPKGT